MSDKSDKSDKQILSSDKQILSSDKQILSSDKQILPFHKKPTNANEFLSTLSPIERKLQELAQEKLGSSYFMEKTSAYKKWHTSLTAKSKK